MKQKHHKIYNAAMALLLLTATGCANQLTGMEELPEQKPTTGKQITVTATQATRGVKTRLVYDEQTNGTVNVTWATADQFYAGKIDAATNSNLPSQCWQPFSLNEGEEGSTSGTFTGDAAGDWQEGDKLYALYGNEDIDNFSLMYNAGTLYLAANYDRQEQTANGSNAHLTDNDQMYASTTYSANATPNFNFKHLGSLMKFTLTLPESGKTVEKLVLSSKNGKELFIDNILLSLNDESRIGSPTSSLTLDLPGEDGNGITLAANELTAYMMIAPTKDTKVFDDNNNPVDIPTLQGKTIRLIVNTTDGDTYIAELTGSPIEAEQFYTVEANLEDISSLFDGGDGTSLDPYQIKDAGQLKTFASLVNSKAFATQGKYFKLTAAEIDLNNEEWSPIGSNNTYFKGTFDGNGCTLKNLKIDNETESDQGLFGQIIGATVKNLKVQGSIKGGEWVGGITGSADSDSYLIGCSFEGDVSGNYLVGGIAGYSLNAYIIGCHKTGSTTATTTQSSENRIGGITGYMESSYAVGCYNTGDVTIATGSGYSSYIGGIGGIYSNIYSCYNTGNVTWTGDTAPTGIGGLIGYAGTATNSYWTKGNITTNCATDGLGTNFYGSQIAASDDINNTLSSLNEGITLWNTSGMYGPQGNTSSPKYCNFHYQNGSTTPALAAGAPSN